MPNSEHLFEEKPEKSSSPVPPSLKKLKSRALQDMKKKSGLSLEFRSQMKSLEKALELGQKAMATLAQDYVKQLSLFKKDQNPQTALHALTTSENIWHKETTTIRALDISGDESLFLNKMRSQALFALENKLIDAADACSRKPTDENAALCSGIINVMDKILDEQDIPSSAKERERLADIAKGFK